MKLIDKDALVAEINMHLECANTGILYAQSGIEKGLKKYESALNAWQHCQSTCKNILSFLDTLEVKEVDLEEENIIGIFEREVKIDAGGYPYIDCDIEFYDYDKDIPLAKEGDKVKVVIVKGE